MEDTMTITGPDAEAARAAFETTLNEITEENAEFIKAVKSQVRERFGKEYADLTERLFTQIYGPFWRAVPVELRQGSDIVQILGATEVVIAKIVDDVITLFFANLPNVPAPEDQIAFTEAYLGKITDRVLSLQSKPQVDLPGEAVN
jgi:hypothetical protein